MNPDEIEVGQVRVVSCRPAGPWAAFLYDTFQIEWESKIIIQRMMYDGLRHGCSVWFYNPTGQIKGPVSPAWLQQNIHLV